MGIIGGSGCTFPSIDASFTTSANDFNPPGLANAVVLRVSASNFLSGTITGLQGGEDGRLLWLVNVGPANIIVNHEDGSSAAANRFRLASNTNKTLQPGAALGLLYDPGVARWIQMCRS